MEHFQIPSALLLFYTTDAASECKRKLVKHMFIPLTFIGQLRTHIRDWTIVWSPALAGRCGNPGDTVFRWRAGCCGDRRWASVSDGDATSEVVTSALPGLLNCSGLWLDDWTVTGMEKVCGAAVDCCEMEQDPRSHFNTTPHTTDADNTWWLKTLVCY